MAVANFHKLESRLRLTGRLITRTGLHIGAGSGGLLGAVDLPVLRDSEGHPFIPGSSLKGALRSTTEAFVRAAADHIPGLRACDPLHEPPPGTDLTDAATRRKYACGAHLSGERASVDPGEHCSVCRLFGSRVVASHVRFSDAHPASGHLAPVELRDAVVLNRDLRAAQHGLKFDFEVVPPGVSFELEIFVENPESWSMGLLAIAFDQLADGFTAIGGYTSRGLGRVDVTWTQLVEITARELFEGERGTVSEDEMLAQRLQEWRTALNLRCQTGKS